LLMLNGSPFGNGAVSPRGDHEARLHFNRSGGDVAATGDRALLHRTKVEIEPYGDMNARGRRVSHRYLNMLCCARGAPPEVRGMWLSTAYYGTGYLGESVATEGYSGVSPRSLDWAETAIFAGRPQAPSAYDPFHHLLSRARVARHLAICRDA
jgi:hypothetical protein